MLQKLVDFYLFIFFFHDVISFVTIITLSLRRHAVFMTSRIFERKMTQPLYFFGKQN